jgi:glycosyltransferase involved in cell wall biosynthesis
LGGAGNRIKIVRVYTYPALHRSFVHRVLSFFSFMVTSFLAGLRVSKVDLVWGTSPPIFQGVTAWLLARLKRAPFLFEVRDLWPAFAIEVGVLQNKLLIRLSEWLERTLYQRADRVVVNSPGFETYVKERGARDVRLVPNGATPDMFDPLDPGTEFRETHNLEDNFVVLYAGAHGMSNDLGVLLEAAALLQDEPGVRIVLVGDGKDKPALQERAARRGLSNVVFLPPVSKLEMPGILAGANACVAILKPIPLYGTVYPNKVFDYMAAGRPVILAIDGVIRELVEGARAGVFTQPGDPHAMAENIRDLAINPELCASMGQNGRAMVQDLFDRRILARQLTTTIEEMVDET